MLYLPPQAKNFLIPPSNRKNFLILFTLLTICGWFVATIASIALEKKLLGSNLINRGIFPWVTIPSSIIFAVILAANQALVLGNYISPRLWTIATTIGWLLPKTLTINLVKYLFPGFTHPQLLSTILYICSGIWLGLSQWLVLRQYTKSSWLWILLPSLCFLGISLFILLAQNLLPRSHDTLILYWSEQSLKAIILGVIPGFSLSRFKKNPTSYLNHN